jgi:hypothetical protein
MKGYVFSRWVYPTPSHLAHYRERQRINPPKFFESNNETTEPLEKSLAKTIERESSGTLMALLSGPKILPIAPALLSLLVGLANLMGRIII